MFVIMVSNKSKTYILPFINELLPIKFLNNLINTYIFYDGDYKFCMKYKFSGKLEFMNYEKEIENNPLYHSTVDINKSEVVYILNIPIELIDTVDLFIQGKYSYINNKEIINKFYIEKYHLPVNNKIWEILYRAESLRRKLEEELNVTICPEMDLSSPPDINNETFKIK